MLLTDHQIALLQAHDTSTYAGSSSAIMLTDILKLTGALVLADKVHLLLFVPKVYTPTFFKNVAENPFLAVVFTCVYTLETYQIKGTYLDFRPCTPQEVQYQQAYVKGFGQHRVALGMKNGLAFANYYQDPSLAIRMKAEEIYEQTPKAGTGKRIR